MSETVGEKRKAVPEDGVAVAPPPKRTRTHTKSSSAAYMSVKTTPFFARKMAGARQLRGVQAEDRDDVEQFRRVRATRNRVWRSIKSIEALVHHVDSEITEQEMLVVVVGNKVSPGGSAKARIYKTTGFSYMQDEDVVDMLGIRRQMNRLVATPGTTPPPSPSTTANHDGTFGGGGEDSDTAPKAAASEVVVLGVESAIRYPPKELDLDTEEACAHELALSIGMSLHDIGFDVEEGDVTHDIIPDPKREDDYFANWINAPGSGNVVGDDSWEGAVNLLVATRNQGKRRALFANWHQMTVAKDQVLSNRTGVHLRTDPTATEPDARATALAFYERNGGEFMALKRKTKELLLGVRSGNIWKVNSHLPFVERVANRRIGRIAQALAKLRHSTSRAARRVLHTWLDEQHGWCFLPWGTVLKGLQVLTRDARKIVVARREKAKAKAKLNNKKQYEKRKARKERAKALASVPDPVRSTDMVSEAGESSDDDDDSDDMAGSGPVSGK